MKQSIRTELTNYINDCKNEGRDITHFNLFNEDYYLIGYHSCSEWLKTHEIDVFEGIDICRENEIEHFGEFNTRIDNSETLVNQLVYWFGQELCNELEIPND
tara:strand:+ start:208 stop:513 length:306 start_codon:yes stop_codon:yes gene_type:complete